MLVDPVTIAANSPTPSLVLPIVKNQDYGTVRLDAVNGFTVTTKHDYLKGGGEKHYIQMVQSKIAADPYSDASTKQIASVSMTIVGPKYGYTSAQLVDVVEALMDYINDSEVTPARLVAFQS